MDADEAERLQAEIELLEAMYPDQVQYDAKSREMKYSFQEGSFMLRLPGGYLNDELPVVLSASAGKDDARALLKQHIQTSSVGEEMLDSLISTFTELAASLASEARTESEASTSSEPRSSTNTADSAKATTIIWLHHLLNTNKRKLALNPPLGVSGITKPGYPGVLIYSGDAKLVHEHIAELKAQNWQAFQVRYETEEEWAFGHGKGVREVEAMKEIVAAVGEGRKEEFMEAMRMK